MSRTSIPIDESTKSRLDEMKRDDETWDEYVIADSDFDIAPLTDHLDVTNLVDSV
jgi:hypothetical protein